jgi:hypothetical protein
VTNFYLKPGAKRGLLIRGGDVLERLAGIDSVVLDKVYYFIYHIFPRKLMYLHYKYLYMIFRQGHLQKENQLLLLLLL